MKYILSNMEPKLPLKYFEDISAIPRGSKNEEAVAKFVENRAKELGLYATRDAKNNVYVRKPGSKGFEDRPAVLLQGHLDMVCEKNADTVHDFTKDGIELVVEGNILRANGTTLGADDGKGVAYMLALMDEDSDKFSHPPMEFLFTTGEEIGFWGALDFDYSQIKARRMIGLDAGPEGYVSTTSAGAQEIIWSIPTDYEPARGQAIEISVGGLKGGHSAMKITAELGNSNKIMGRVLHNVAKVCDYRLCSVSGGLMFNAIPREAKAVILITDGNKAKAIETIEKVWNEIKVEYSASDPDVTIKVRDADAQKALSQSTTKAVTEALYCIPNGVRMMNKAVDGLPITSTNMGIVKTSRDEITIDTMTRSSSKTLNDEYVDVMCTVAAMCGMPKVKIGTWLPAWPYNPTDKMRRLSEKMYKEKTGKDMGEVAVHGGLELGVFSENLPGLEITTLGCTSGNEHTVTEWMDIDSYNRVYRFLKEFIENLTK